jgi:hypothetical protein
MRRNQGGRCKCEACGASFTGLSAFDMHRTGEYALGRKKPSTRRCLSAGEMRAKGMVEGERGAWTAGGDFKWARRSA